MEAVPRGAAPPRAVPLGGLRRCRPRSAATGRARRSLLERRHLLHQHHHRRHRRRDHDDDDDGARSTAAAASAAGDASASASDDDRDRDRDRGDVVERHHETRVR